MAEASYCVVCQARIHEGTSRKQGDEAVECEGTCSGWLHRRCAGLSKGAFDVVSKSQSPFYCPYCMLQNQGREIASLRDLVANLSGEVTSLRSQLLLITQEEGNQPSLIEQVKVLTSELKALKEKVTTPPVEAQASYATAVTGKAPSNTGKTGQSPPDRELDRRFNLVVTGIPECSSFADKLSKQAHDIDKTSQVLSSVVESISASSIKDLYRLGKYNSKSSRPRPLATSKISTGI